MFDYYSKDGITLMVEFKCMRKGCENTYLGPLELHRCHDEGSKYLHNLKLPDGWSKHWCGRLLCHACTERIRSFLNEGEIDI